MALCFFSALSITARTIPDPTDATGFFTTVANKLLRSTFNFGVTNIPVQTNGVFCFTPAVHRLLQVAANVRDASVTNFYPTIYRPIFFNDGQGNVYITDFELITSSLQPDYPLAQSPIYASALPVGLSTNNVYDVPWIIGAKKGFPNFNQFAMRTDVQVTRMIQVSRAKVEAWNAADAADFKTNMMYVMSISNHIGFSFWNSYSSNYVSPSGANLNVVMRDTSNMVLSNALYNGMSGAGPSGWPSPQPVVNTFVVGNGFPVWPGSAWNLQQNPSTRIQSINTNSFITGTFDVSFLPPSAYYAGSATFVPISQSPPFDTSINYAYNLPPFNLYSTNGIQAYILDGDQIIDYVQLSGPSSAQNINSEIMDLFEGANNAPYQMWYTNLNLGYFNQIVVSEKGPGSGDVLYAPTLPPNSWIAPPNMPPGTATPQGEADFFEGMFTPGGIWNYSGKVYYNTNLVMQTPYTPTRVVYDYVLWQANDPLVHFLSSDLNESNGYTGFHRSDSPTMQPIPAIATNLYSVGDRYQPWGCDQLLDEMVGDDRFQYNYAMKDPLVWSSDDWNFPATNALPLFSLGQIHRGTPWQTIFLKGTNLLDYIDTTKPNPAVGETTWQTWAGDYDVKDSAIMSPTSDWRLAAVLTEMFNTNDATQLASVNTANWPQLLDGIQVLTNSTALPTYQAAPELDAYLMSGNSTQAAFIVNAISFAQSNQPNQTFASVGDILNAQEISCLSPWLNISGLNQAAYGISDEALEAIPSQLLPLLRPDSAGSMIFTNGSVHVQFSGGDGFCYALQVSTNLASWQIIGTNSPSQGIFTVPVSGPVSQFYRTSLLP